MSEGNVAVTDFLNELKRKRSTAIPAAEAIIEWAGSRGLHAEYGAKGSEFRIRMRADGADETHESAGPSVITLIAKSGGLTVQLRHLLRRPAFRDDRNASEELVARLEVAASVWDRAPAARGFPSTPLSRIGPPSPELAGLIDTFDWIVDRLLSDEGLRLGARSVPAGGARRAVAPPTPVSAPLIASNRVARHERVFIAGVGTSAEPMEDNWLETERGELHLRKIWMSRPSRELTAGDHVFAVRAGGLRDVIMLAEATGPTILDPHEWPHASDLQYGFPLQPLVVVDGASTRHLPWLSAPRSGVHLVVDPDKIADLYTSVAHGIRWPTSNQEDESGAGSSRPDYQARLQTVRRSLARPFDPEMPPSARAIPKRNADPEQSALLLERAEQGHHALLVAVHNALGAQGWGQIHQRPTSIDLEGQAPDGTTVIFEAKTIRGKNLLGQVRGGLAQLLEYRHFDGPPDAELCLVVDAQLPIDRLHFLASLEVSVLRVADGRIREAFTEHRAITDLVSA